MITENLSTLKIYKLTQEQYDKRLEEGTLEENALYLTPDEEVDLSGYATIELLDEKVSTSRTINGKTLNEDIILSATDIGADVSGSADTALSESKTYTDNAVAQKSQVQIITWEVDD